MGSHVDDTKDVKDLSRLIRMAVILSSVSRILIALNHLAWISGIEVKEDREPLPHFACFPLLRQAPFVKTVTGLHQGAMPLV